MRLFLTAMILTMLAQPSVSLEIKTDQLYQICKSWEQTGFSDELYPDKTNQGVCLGYMDAWASILRMRCFTRMTGGADLKRHQLAQAFMNYAAKHPEYWELPPTHLASQFLTKFPCKQ